MRVGDDHWLEGVKRDILPPRGAMPIRRFLVQHFTAGWADAVAVMRSRGVSAHFVVQRDGEIIQCVPCNQAAYHAGQSRWKDPKTGKVYTGLNSCSIGIEIANCGDLQRERFPSTMGPPLAGTPIPRLRAAHKNGGGIREWEVYPEAQLLAVEELSRALVARYNLDDLVGHDDIAPTRKADPGPAFPLARMRVACGFPADIIV
jgi:N-acetylmuramoyl-L-alanine amidase